jgi:hypothetical protein
MVPVERIELPTFGLQNRCSTAELNRLKAIDRIDVQNISGGRIRMPRDGSVYGRGPGRVNRRTVAKPLSGRGVATRLGDRVVGAGGAVRQTFKGRVSHGERISASAHARLSS